MSRLFTDVQHQLLSFPAHKSVCLALSGGLDSMVLLDILAMLQRDKRYSVKVSAVHVNHQLQAEADSWQIFCAQRCADYGIPLVTLTVDVQPQPGDSVEAIARDCRYAALAQQLPPDAVLLTAHHQSDQAETWLLQNCRGAGVKGLSAMAAWSDFAQGYLARPLLTFTRACLLDYALARQLTWQEDKSNTNQRFDRNFIRHEIIPRLTSRWPSCEKTFARSAQLSAEAMRLNAYFIEEKYHLIAQSDEQGVALSVPLLQVLPAPVQAEIVRYWLQQLAVKPAQRTHIQQIQQSLLSSEYKATAQVKWADVVIRRYRNKLVCMIAKLPCVTHDYSAPWQGEEWILLPPGCGTLQCRQVLGQGLSLGYDYRIGFRLGGERFHAQGRPGSHPLKKCFQEWGIPPWLRGQIPLIKHGAQVVAVVGYAISEQYFVNPDEAGVLFEHSL